MKAARVLSVAFCLLDFCELFTGYTPLTGCISGDLTPGFVPQKTKDSGSKEFFISFLVMSTGTCVHLCSSFKNNQWARDILDTVVDRAGEEQQCSLLRATSEKCVRCKEFVPSSPGSKEYPGKLFTIVGLQERPF